MSEEIKFPLTKKAKAEFVKNYELIFLKVPPHNIKDETLVQMVNDNLEKLTGNVKTNEQPPQEGIQNEGGKRNSADESQKGDEENGKVSPDEERIYQLENYKKLHGEDAGENLSTSEITALNLAKENFLTGSREYFDLFGKQPIEGMTNQQIFSAIENEKNRLEKGKTQSVEKVDAVDDSLKHDEETEMVIQKKKDPSDKRVINKNTFPYLKHDFEEVVKVPKEIQNKK